jgi:hypothetical protein
LERQQEATIHTLKVTVQLHPVFMHTLKERTQQLQDNGRTRRGIPPTPQMMERTLKVTTRKQQTNMLTPRVIQLLLLAKLHMLVGWEQKLMQIIKQL